MSPEQWQAAQDIIEENGFDGRLSNPDTWKRYPNFRAWVSDPGPPDVEENDG